MPAGRLRGSAGTQTRTATATITNTAANGNALTLDAPPHAFGPLCPVIEGSLASDGTHDRGVAGRGPAPFTWVGSLPRLWSFGHAAVARCPVLSRDDDVPASESAGVCWHAAMGELLCAPAAPAPSVGDAMDELDSAHLAALHALGDEPVPDIVLDVAAGREAELVWRNELGGLTFRVDDRFVKWNPRRTGIDLDRERVRLEWISSRHPAPRLIAAGADATAQWIVTAALQGDCAVGDTWRARRPEAIKAIAQGLRAIHTIPINDFPSNWTPQVWVGRTPESLGPRPPIDDPVLVHGDACAPNTLISLAGEWTGNVDFGDLAVGDRWADLAVASLSLDWNFGEGHQGELFDAYGVEPDEERISYYRQLWHLES